MNAFLEALRVQGSRKDLKINVKNNNYSQSK
jgi:hypothetical protein